MISDLFPDCRQDSPRLAWMKRHGVHTEKAPAEITQQWRIFMHNDSIMCWFATMQGSNLSGSGTSDEDACIDLAFHCGIPLWNEEQYAKEKTK